MKVVLRCPVRACGGPLKRDASRWACPREHSFDQHRHGFLNLLQPQDRRSRNPGDSREAAQARRRLVTSGALAPVFQAVANGVRPVSSRGPVSLLDVGCGEGGFLRTLDGLALVERHGVDISSPSIELAAKASPDVLFVVANADRSLPYADGSFDVLTSIDARTPAREFQRVLTEPGLILVAVPAPDDLIELRERIQGARVEKPRAVRVAEDLAEFFALTNQMTVRENRTIESAHLRDLLRVSYRGFRQSERSAVEALDPMTVTMSHDVLTFERRR